jgi:ribulose-phosphate 3-epimerase
MSQIVPTVTAYDGHEYQRQVEVITKFARRIHVDLMDGVFAPTKSPDIDNLWLPEKVVCDVHLMFQHPYRQIKKLLSLNPSMVILQAEADQKSVLDSIAALKQTRVRVGVSLLAATSPDDDFVYKCIALADHVLIFSGHLGYHGGTADFGLLDKVSKIKAINHTAEIGWDGGISFLNVSELVAGGVGVLNTGGAIHGAENPSEAYKKLVVLAA